LYEIQNLFFKFDTVGLQGPMPPKQKVRCQSPRMDIV